MSPGERARHDAKLLAERLRAEGRPMDARIVSRLVKSAASSAANNSLFWTENRELRDRLAQAEREAVG